MRAALALGDIGEPAVKPLVRALKEPDQDVRWLAGLALGNIGVIRALEPLKALKQDADEYVRKAAEDAIEKIHTKNR